MALGEFDSLVAHSVGLDIDGTRVATFTEFSGLKQEFDVIEIKQNTPDGKYLIKKEMGRMKAGEVTLSAPMTQSKVFTDWTKQVLAGQVTAARKNCSIILYSTDGTEVRRFNLTNVWPKTVDFGTYKAGDTNAVMEKVTLVYEEIHPQ